MDFDYTCKKDTKIFQKKNFRPKHGKPSVGASKNDIRLFDNFLKTLKDGCIHVDLKLYPGSIKMRPVLKMYILEKEKNS